MSTIPKIDNLKSYLDQAQRSALAQKGSISALNASSMSAVSPVVGTLGSLSSIMGTLSQVGNLVTNDLSEGSTDHAFTPREEAQNDKKVGNTVGSVVSTIASIIGTILMFL